MCCSLSPAFQQQHGPFSFFFSSKMREKLTAARLTRGFLGLSNAKKKKPQKTNSGAFEQPDARAASVSATQKKIQKHCEHKRRGCGAKQAAGRL
jgi:hypothetical protein